MGAHVAGLLVARRVRAGAHAHEALEFLGASLRVVAHGLNASTLASRTQMCGRRLRHKHKQSAFDRTSTPAFDNLEFAAKTLNLPPSHKATAADAQQFACASTLATIEKNSGRKKNNQGSAVSHQTAAACSRIPPLHQMFSQPVCCFVCATSFGFGLTPRSNTRQPPLMIIITAAAAQPSKPRSMQEC